MNNKTALAMTIENQKFWLKPMSERTLTPSLKAGAKGKK
jgi:hypothetical protein